MDVMTYALTSGDDISVPKWAKLKDEIIRAPFFQVEISPLHKTNIKTEIKQKKTKTSFQKKTIFSKSGVNN